MKALKFLFAILFYSLLVTSEEIQSLDSPKIQCSDTEFWGSCGIELTHSSPEAELRYTLDGSDPGLTSEVYEGPLTLYRSCIIKARAFVGGRSSAVSSQIVQRLIYSDMGFCRGWNLVPILYEFTEDSWYQLLGYPMFTFDTQQKIYRRARLDELVIGAAVWIYSPRSTIGGMELEGYEPLSSSQQFSKGWHLTAGHPVESAIYYEWDGNHFTEPDELQEDQAYLMQVK